MHMHQNLRATTHMRLFIPFSRAHVCHHCAFASELRGGNRVAAHTSANAEGVDGCEGKKHITLDKVLT